MAAPTVSVIVVTRDRPQLLADALAGVAAQTAPPLELRLADDGGGASLDQLPPLPLLEVSAVATRFGNPGLARNSAADGARGDVLAFLDDDDRWTPEHLARLGAAFADDAVGFAWTDTRVVRERVDDLGTRTELDSRVIARDWDDALMRTDDFLPPSAWGVRRELFEALGGFDASFTASEDWDFLLRMDALLRERREAGVARASARVRVPGVSVEVRLRDAGNTSAVFDEARWACLRRLEQRHGLAPLAPKTFWEVALAVSAAEAR